MGLTAAKDAGSPQSVKTVCMCSIRSEHRTQNTKIPSGQDPQKILRIPKYHRCILNDLLLLDHFTTNPSIDIRKQPRSPHSLKESFAQNSNTKQLSRFTCDWLTDLDKLRHVATVKTKALDSSANISAKRERKKSVFTYGSLTCEPERRHSLELRLLQPFPHSSESLATRLQLAPGFGVP